MKNIIREKRREKFDNKRITPKIIRDIVNIIEEEVTSSVKKSENIYLLYSMDTDDESSYESQSSEIFKDLENKIIEKIVMRFNTIDNSKNIEVQIVGSSENDKSENFILISGDESNWVNGIKSRISHIISMAESQPKYRDKMSGLMIVTVVLFNWVYFKFFYDKIEGLGKGLLPLLLMLGVPIISLYGGNKLFKYFATLYPAVELQTGPDYFQLAKKNRRNMYWILATIIIPLVLALVYDYVKSQI